ncbi:PREDICTED: ADP-ribosylation factor-like protein 2-binding protein [Amphimedon queenslandica]|uniref:ADP-ribosylation factor-like protein 2-binding protein n=1 Tax=Amphimedon queenslandica TaxID=400682 RepID=A0A1X7V4L4_AMPQE|nr:PREDICTED: ADP-ribosylation factor-like protein 2-binding protein [Amphimedon queenslandica]|eukprot:XP_003385703.1 PREDICTED: ADP-ribosylation factor-like protein 2-binding protein [Amphimedon queenslandica]
MLGRMASSMAKIKNGVTEDKAKEENGEIFLEIVGNSQDGEFDIIIGHLQDIIIDEEFLALQHSFMDEHYHYFEDVEENKLIYTDIQKKYTELVEKHIETQLEMRIPHFDMTKFLQLLESKKSEIPEEIFEILLSFTDFLTFKQMFLDYKADKEGLVPDLGGLIISSPFDASR